ncbi:MAG: CHAD domain-containing protein [Solirubrobacteraceae bacterium]
MSKLDDVPKPVVAALAATGAAATAAKLVGDRRAEERAAERAFELRRGEAVPEGIRRIARAQIEDAAQALREHADAGEAVHSARKSFKRVRSTLRLVSSALDEDTRRQENAAIREAGRRLSGARDSQVMLETLDELSEREPDRASSWEAFRALLAAEHERAQAALKADHAATSAVAGELHEAELRIGGWVFAGARRPRQLLPGLRTIYGRGRRDLRRARRDPSAENLHEWRKRSKDLWYGAQILRPVAPGPMKKLASDAHDLSDLLGSDHDLAVLREEALANQTAFATPAGLESLLDAIDTRSAELRRHAFKRGRKLYRRKPRRWQQRLTS